MHSKILSFFSSISKVESSSTRHQYKEEGDGVSLHKDLLSEFIRENDSGYSVSQFNINEAIKDIHGLYGYFEEDSEIYISSFGYENHMPIDFLLIHMSKEFLNVYESDGLFIEYLKLLNVDDFYVEYQSQKYLKPSVYNMIHDCCDKICTQKLVHDERGFLWGPEFIRVCNILHPNFPVVQLASSKETIKYYETAEFEAYINNAKALYFKFIEMSRLMLISHGLEVDDDLVFVEGYQPIQYLRSMY